MASPDKPHFASNRGFDFKDPVLPKDLIDQMFRERPGVPVHWTQRPELQKTSQPEPRGTIFESRTHNSLNAEPQPTT